MRGRATIGVGLTVLAVLLLAEVIALALSGQWPEPREWSTPEAQTKIDQIETLAASGGVEVVLLGSSVIDVAVDPALLQERAPGAPSTYNAGLGAGTLRMVEVWAREFVLDDLTPETVVVGLSSRDLNANDPRQPEREAEFLASQPVEAALGTEGVLDRIERHLEGWSELVRYRTVLRNPRNFARGDETSTDAPLTGPSGHFRDFLDGRYAPSDRAERFFREGPLHDFTVGREKVAALERLLTDLDEAGIATVLVDMPVTRDYVDLHPDGYATYERVVERLAGEHGVAFIDPGVWDDRFFADPLHLNREGVQRFTDLLGTSLPVRTGSR